MPRSQYSRWHKGDVVEFRHAYNLRKWVGGVVQQVTRHGNHVRYVIVDEQGRKNYLVEERDVRGITEATIQRLTQEKYVCLGY